MAVTRSKLFRQTKRQVIHSFLESIQNGSIDDFDVDAFVARSDSKTAEAMYGIVRALKNVRIAARYLKQVGAPSFRCPRGTTYYQLINYHHTLAVHEAGVIRNRLLRVLVILEDAERERGRNETADVLKELRRAVRKPGDAVQAQRNLHVHEETQFAPGLVQVDLKARFGLPGRQRTVKRKAFARRCGEYWLRTANSMDAHAHFTIGLADLVVSGRLTRTRARVELRRVKIAAEALGADFPE